LTLPEMIPAWLPEVWEMHDLIRSPCPLYLIRWIS
jgi:hypothetical protein